MRLNIYGKKYRFLCLVAAVLVFVQAFTFFSYAYEEWPEDCYVLSEGACLMDGDSGVVLFKQNADVSYYPASITKVMTALVTIENCDNLMEMVTFSYDAVHIEEQNSTIIGASEGDKLSVLDCLYCLLFQSANEVANALAEHVGAKHPELKEKGMTDQQVFVVMMNQKAEELGCTGTHFNNPSGLTDEQHYTTPYDMCLIMQAAIRNDTFLDIESHSYWTHAPIYRYPDADDPWNTVYMKHMMLRKNTSQYYEGCIAGKTGYTVTAGNTLVTACRRDDMTLVCCVMNAHANHYNDTTRLFDFGYKNFKSCPVSDLNDTDEQIQEDFRIGGIPVLDSYTLGLEEGARVTIPKKGDIYEVTQEFVLSEETSDGYFARMNYFYGERLCGYALMKLIPLGGMDEVREAGEDPLFYEIAGIEKPVEESPESTVESVSDGMQEEDSQTVDAEGSSKAGIDETGTSGTVSVDTDSGEGNVVQNSTAETGENKGHIVRIVCFVILGLVVLLAVFVLLRYRSEMKEEKRRRKRRLEHMKRVADLPGSMQIEMDLEANRKTDRKTDRKTKRRNEKY